MLHINVLWFGENAKTEAIFSSALASTANRPVHLSGDICLCDSLFGRVCINFNTSKKKLNMLLLWRMDLLALFSVGKSGKNYGYDYGGS